MAQEEVRDQVFPHIRAETTWLGIDSRASNKSIVVTKTSEIRGTVEAPPSKSYTHRAIIAASLGPKNETSVIENPLLSDDTSHVTIEVCRKLGARLDLEKQPNGRTLLRVQGFGRQPQNPGRLDFKGSGSTLRIMLPILGLVDGEVELTGDESLQKRPNKDLVNVLKAFGIRARAQEKRTYNLPLRVQGTKEIRGGKYELHGQGGAIFSSQYISSLLIACPLAKEDSAIQARDKVVSRPYIDVTMDVIHSAGIRGVIKYGDYNRFEVTGDQEYKALKLYPIPGDYSSAAFLMAAACIIESDVKIKGLGVKDSQGDRRIIDLLNRMGAEIGVSGDAVHVKGPFDLHGIKVDCWDNPDLVPVLAAVGVFAKGQTKITNVPHLRVKESNRILSLADTLQKLNVSVSSDRDSLTIRHSASKLKKEERVWSHKDHRIAMALSLIGLRMNKLVIESGSSIAKSYPKFVEHMTTLNANIQGPTASELGFQ